MKRALVAIPTIAAMVGLLILFWNTTEERKSLDAGNLLPPPAPKDTLDSSRSAPDPAPSVPPVAAPGNLRVIVRANGLPVGGARLAVLRLGTEEHGSYETQSDGTATIHRLPAGHYAIEARSPRHISASVAATVIAGRTEEVLIGLGEGGRVRGVVTGPGGAPLAGVAVKLLDPLRKKVHAPDPAARTDAEGRYEIEAVPLQEMGIHFRHDRYKPWMRMGLHFRHAGETHEVNAELDPGIVVGGRVTDASSGAPIESATVMVVNDPREQSALVRTDKEGRFAAYGIGDAMVNVSASATGYGTCYLRGIAPPASASIEIRMQRAGEVVGRIETEPIPESYMVSLSRYDVDLRREERVQTRTMSGRAFAVKDAAPGVYWVDVEATGYEMIERPQVSVVSGQPSAEVRVRLKKK